MSDREKPQVGRTSYSFQHRCTQWEKHSPPYNLPYPCEGCYTLAAFDVVIPWTPFVPYTELHDGSMVTP